MTVGISGMAIVDTRCPLGEGSAASETSFGVNLLALLATVGVSYVAYGLGVKTPGDLFVLGVVSLLIWTVVLEYVFFGPRSALGRLRIRRSLSWRRIVYRETALVLTLAAIGCAYWVFPAFSEAGMVKHFHPFSKLLAGVLLALSLPYFCVMDCVDIEEEDALCRVGKAVWTFRKTLTRFAFANYVRSWIVKAFWLSLMQPQMVEKIRIFLYYRWERLAGDPIQIYLMASTCCYAIDLAYAASGYLLNLKLFNTHTRSAEPTLLGWVVTLACYWPFWGVLLNPYFFRYEGSLHWYDHLFAAGSVGWWGWAAGIVLLELLYALATVCAGIRFSNLTYRGLWNTGLYRLTKHPAYVFKNLSWWMVSVPFLLNSGTDAVKCTLMLLGTNLLYYWRARTEERHLSHYPEYVAYALEMNDRSIFRWVARLLPFLKYRRPTDPMWS